ncbi:hypothetical protein GHT06_021568 [Daphnia sinensis]|uniref:Uncharacterized protein n=1 Tax=Daphnia sinensis TaxID=1820382 RepID=A0AAD5L0W3_9CRUS|nr:hypothetical protein GHT06_021568 [Daphnia sinensis]
MVNLTNRRTYLRGDTVLGQVEAVDSSVVKIEEVEPEKGREQAAAASLMAVMEDREGSVPVPAQEVCRIPRQAFRAQIAENLPQTDVEDLVDLLQESDTCFALKDSELGFCK